MSKITHYIFAVVALLLISTHNVCAQKERKDREAALEALGKVLGTKSEEADTIFVEQHIGKVFKKDPAFFAGVAEIFQGKKNDTLRAMKYINQALEIDDEYADAYRIAGDLRMKRCKMYNFKEGIPSTADTLAAIDWYERGTLADPKDPKCYEKYANLVSIYDIDKAENKFQTLAKANPAYPVNLSRARMYRNLAEMVEGDSTDNKVIEKRRKYPHLWNKETLKHNNQKAMEAYMASNMADFDTYDYNRYIFASTGANRTVYAIDTACVAAMNAFPDSTSYARAAYTMSAGIAMNPPRDSNGKIDSSYVQLWANKTLHYLDVMFNKTDYEAYLDNRREKDATEAAKIQMEDLFNQAQFYQMVNNDEKANETFEKVIIMDIKPEGYIITEGRRDAAKRIISYYNKKDKYQESLDVCLKLHAKLDELGKHEAKDDQTLINVYRAKAGFVQDNDSLAHIEYKNIIDVCEKMIERYPDFLQALDYAYFNVIQFGAVVDTAKVFLYESQAKRYIEFVDKHPEYVPRDEMEFSTQIAVAYNYLAVCCFYDKRYDEAYDYVNEALVYAPSYKQSLTLKNIIETNNLLSRKKRKKK